MPQKSPLDLLTPDEREIEERCTEALDKLGEAGWMFGGGGPNVGIGVPGEINLGVGLPREMGELRVEDLKAILSDAATETGIIEGWNLHSEDEPESDGLVSAEYSGQIDNLERGVTAMAAALDPEVLAANQSA